MISGAKVYALIPARAGSKRLKKKNVHLLGGRPLISWTIQAAKDCQYIDEILISTDCSDVVSAATDLNIEVPKLRPAYLANDTATSEEVIFYTLAEHEIADGLLVLLQPTSPLRIAKDIDGAVERIRETGSSIVVSVTECEHSPLWAGKLDDDGLLQFADTSNARSQDLPTFYRLNGAIYVYDIRRILERKSIDVTSGVAPFVMPRDRSVDVDTLEDIELAKFYLNKARDAF